MGRDDPLWLRIRPPLWARWGLSLLVAAAAVVALIAFVHHNSNNNLAHVGTAAERRASREATVVVGQDQAPRTIHLAAGAGVAPQLVAAVRGDMGHRIATGNISGPLQRVHCARTGGHGSAVAYGCDARANGMTYPFLAVATPTRHRAVYCKRDVPPRALREHPGQPELPASVARGPGGPSGPGEVPNARAR